MKDTPAFERLDLLEKHKLLKEKGNYVAARYFGSYLVHLYELNGKYVEVWRMLGLNKIQWIEVLKNDAQLDSYLENIQIKL